MCASAPSAQPVSIPLIVRYPGEGAQIGAVDASFAFGETAPGASVTVNGRPALIAPSGGWIAHVPFSPGRFVLRVIAHVGDSTSEVDRTVWVMDGSESAYPAVTTIVQPGDTLDLAVSAPHGSAVSANGPGFTNVAMALDPSSRLGTYRAYVFAPHRAAGPARVVYHIEPPHDNPSDVASTGTLEIASHPVIFAGHVIAYEPDPDSGARPYGMIETSDGTTTFTVPLGTQLAVTGRVGDLYEVALPGDSPAWIDRREVAVDGAATHVLTAKIVASHTVERENETQISISLSGSRVPFRVIEEPTGADGIIRLYGAGAVANPSANVPFSLHQHAFWGYRSRWSGNDLIITFRKPPAFSAAPQPALRGLKIVVDPGHAPDSGAVGPVGTIERDVNLDIATRLSEKLRKLGADVVMTRTSGAGIRLYDRPALAERLGATALISVHNNAPPDGVDPSYYRGYNIYYFAQHSKALAQAMHDQYARDTDLPDGGVHRGDYALVRTSELPAVLTESAFITWPWEEMKLRDPTFRDRLAMTMADGTERWAERMRKIETGI
jgi:N-acetylmuramoyl-L-alanine amidase